MCRGAFSSKEQVLPLEAPEHHMFFLIVLLFIYKLYNTLTEGHVDPSQRVSSIESNFDYGLSLSAYSCKRICFYWVPRIQMQAVHAPLIPICFRMLSGHLLKILAMASTTHNFQFFISLHHQKINSKLATCELGVQRNYCEPALYKVLEPHVIMRAVR